MSEIGDPLIGDTRIGKFIETESINRSYQRLGEGERGGNGIMGTEFV